jgi:hypothetical protein
MSHPHRRFGQMAARASLTLEHYTSCRARAFHEPFSQAGFQQMAGTVSGFLYRTTEPFSQAGFQQMAGTVSGFLYRTTEPFTGQSFQGDSCKLRVLNACRASLRSLSGKVLRQLKKKRQPVPAYPLISSRIRLIRHCLLAGLASPVKLAIPSMIMTFGNSLEAFTSSLMHRRDIDDNDVRELTGSRYLPRDRIDLLLPSGQTKYIQFFCVD